MTWKINDDYTVITKLDDPSDFIQVTPEGQVLLILMNAVMHYVSEMDGKIQDMEAHIRELQLKLAVGGIADAQTKH